MNTDRDWNEQLKALHAQSYAWSLFCCNRDADMAKDTLQTVYLKVYEGKACYSGNSSLKSWLFSVIRNTSIDQLRRKGAHHETLDERHSQIPDEPKSPEFDRRRAFLCILNSLSPQQRTVLTLAFYHDLTLDEVAQTLGLSLGSVRAHYERGKQNFRKLLVKNPNVELL